MSLAATARARVETGQANADDQRHMSLREIASRKRLTINQRLSLTALTSTADPSQRAPVDGLRETQERMLRKDLQFAVMLQWL